MRREVRLAFEAGRALALVRSRLPAGRVRRDDELLAVSRGGAEFGAPLVPHVRNEGAGVLGAVEELIDGRGSTGAPLHLSHLKSLADERLIEPLLALIESADFGVTFDQYPYGAGATLLAGLLPAWAQRAAPRRRSRGCATRREGADRAGRRARPARLGRTSSGRSDRSIAVARRSLDRARRRPPAGRHRVRPLLETELAAPMILHYASEDAVRAIARTPLPARSARTASSASTRTRGSTARRRRFLGRYAIRHGLVPIEEAVARLTARAADLLGLADRGRIEVGKRADLVLLDPARYVDTATYDDRGGARTASVGVWVAGEAVVRDGRGHRARPAGVLRVNAARAAPRAPPGRRRTGSAGAASRRVEVRPGSAGMPWSARQPLAPRVLVAVHLRPQNARASGSSARRPGTVRGLDRARAASRELGDAASTISRGPLEQRRAPRTARRRRSRAPATGARAERVDRPLRPDRVADAPRRHR
jgi:hypothetical protein